MVVWSQISPQGLFGHTSHCSFVKQTHGLNALLQNVDLAFKDAEHVCDRYHPWVPNFDVLETEHAFYIGGDFPGIADKESIILEWDADCNLVVRGRITPLDLEAEWDVGSECKPS